MAVSLNHQPVLLHEAVDALAIRPDGIYVDGTFGRGGHSSLILQQLDSSGRLVALDRDPDAIRSAAAVIGGDPRFSIEHVSFDALEEVSVKLGIKGEVDGVLLDLGVSSPQLEDAQRGFSFMHNGPLDMRMNPDDDLTAAAWLSDASQQQIKQVLSEYGEERYSGRIATAIVSRRQERPLMTTTQLAELIDQAVPRKDPGKHPATRTFQAIRIRINQELQQLSAVLEQALSILRPGGRLSVISFHSLEDRIVKRFLRDHSRVDTLPKGVPVMASQLQQPQLRLVGKAVTPSREEIRENPRARSSRLRIAEKSA
ncbi:MAG: 16S rRNA (cytosine(1402)-N(4))-methyltransferase RsmH [Gammaproteobacteria bacterium]|nr:16S rRNA (cytosine(1402)-N(4))-methyltransferase RsmH [Gammaproteobacteria bacterium]